MCNPSHLRYMRFLMAQLVASDTWDICALVGCLRYVRHLSPELIGLRYVRPMPQLRRTFVPSASRFRYGIMIATVDYFCYGDLVRFCWSPLRWNLYRFRWLLQLRETLNRFRYGILIASATLMLLQAFAFLGLCASAYSPPSTISSSLVSLATQTLTSISSFRPFMHLNFHTLHQRCNYHPQMHTIMRLPLTARSSELAPQKGGNN